MLSRFNEKCFQFFYDLRFILASQTTSRRRLFFSYLRLYLHQLLFSRLREPKKITVMGQTFNLHAFYPFYNLWREVYLREVYYFKAKGPKPRIIDGGANIGDTALYYKHLYPHAKILAVEPNPENVALLTKNIADNNLENVEVVEAALSDTAGEIELFVNPSDKNQGGGTIVEGHTKHKENWRQVKVKTISLAELIESAGEVDCLKLDVEGVEAGLIADLDRRRMLTKVATIVMEFHYKKGDLKANSFADTVRILEQNGYAIQIFTQSDIPAGVGMYKENPVHHFQLHATRYE